MGDNDLVLTYIVKKKEAAATTRLHVMFRKKDGSGWYITSDVKKAGFPVWLIVLMLVAVFSVIGLPICLCCGCFSCCCGKKEELHNYHYGERPGVSPGARPRVVMM